ncbi:MAG TPA: DUF4870 domain-containing protein [Steroidobacteraceae bacterium]|nr:DUF4870 domain-containing protein [Steroidobacteraceae bacterium]
MEQQERNWGMLAHLTALAGLFFPLGNVIAPLIIWLSWRDRSAYVGAQAKEALNFNITAALAVLVCYALTWILIGFIALAILGIAWFVLTVHAAIQASSGVQYRYPFALRLVS